MNRKAMFLQYIEISILFPDCLNYPFEIFMSQPESSLSPYSKLLGISELSNYRRLAYTNLVEFGLVRHLFTNGILSGNWPGSALVR